MGVDRSRCRDVPANAGSVAATASGRPSAKSCGMGGIDSVRFDIACERRGECVAVEAPGEQAVWTDPDELVREAGTGGFGVNDGFGLAADLDAARRPRIDRRQIVD